MSWYVDPSFGRYSLSLTVLVTKIGGSYATMPRIAERRTLRNWYQRNYPYAWIGGRVAYDVKE